LFRRQIYAIAGELSSEYLEKTEGIDKRNDYSQESTLGSVIKEYEVKIDLYLDNFEISFSDEYALEKLDQEEEHISAMKNILLESQQKELLTVLVEAARNVPRDERRKFVCSEAFGSPPKILHPGFLNGEINWYLGDVETLANADLLSTSYTSGNIQFDITPLGFEYYRYLKHERSSTERIEDNVRVYLHTDEFRSAHPAAFSKWAEAEKLLWESDSEEQATVIGHHCREAMQEFVTELVDRFQPTEVDKDKSLVIKRLKAVINQNSDILGKTEKRFLEALVEYWESINDLIQRQEHGAKKEGKQLVWIDSRRVVFQLAILMFEIESTLARLSDRG